MGCNCGKQRVIDPSQAATMANTNVPVAQYTVMTPDGASKSFDRYIDAAIYRRQTNGQLTTTNA